MFGLRAGILVPPATPEALAPPQSTGSLAFTTTSLAGAKTGVAYTGQLAAQGGSGNSANYLFWRHSMYPHRQLWHTCSPSGALGGTPQSAPLSGIETATYGVYDIVTHATAFVTLTIAVAASGSLDFATGAMLPMAYVGAYYAFQILGEGGQPEYLMQTSGLSQPWCMMPNGWVYGAPTGLGNQTFTVSLTDTYTQTPVTKTFTIPVAASAFFISGIDPNNGMVNVPPGKLGAVEHWAPICYGGTGTGQSFVITGSVPPGMTFNTSNGGLDGTLTQPGTYTWSAVGTDSGSNVTPSVTFCMVVRPADIVTRPSYNTGTGAFVANGVTYDANGVRFIPHGINRVHDDSADWPSGTNGARTGANYVREEFCYFGNRTISQMNAQMSGSYTANKIYAMSVKFLVQADITGSMPSPQIHITAVGTGTIAIGMTFTGGTIGIYSTPATITGFVSGTSGGPGYYTCDCADVNTGVTFAGSNGSSFTATTTNITLTVTAVSSTMSLTNGGIVCIGMGVSGGSINAQLTGTSGSTGTYQVQGTSGVTAFSGAQNAATGNTSGLSDSNVVVGATNMHLYRLAQGFVPDFINIANEWGYAANWKTTYITAIAAFRAAGYTGPLVIDAPQAGLDWQTVVADGPAVQASDPEQNVIISFHAYGDAVQNVTCQIVGVSTAGGNTTLTLSTDTSVTANPMSGYQYLNQFYVAGVTGIPSLNGYQPVTPYNVCYGSAGAWTVVINATYSGTYTGGGTVTGIAHYEVPMAALAALQASNVCVWLGEYGPPSPWVPYQYTNVTTQDIVASAVEGNFGESDWAWDDGTSWGQNGSSWFGMANGSATGGGYVGVYAAPGDLTPQGLDRILNPHTGLKYLGVTAASFG